MNPNLKQTIREYGESILIAFVLAMFIRTFFVQAFKIPTGSMRPTLIEGDRILVNKLIYRFKEPRRGDIIVFRYPLNPKRDFIKRLIGLEGETVEINNGNIFINGEPTDNEILRKFYYYNYGKYGKEGVGVKVPERSFFVLGDNSAVSRDSRYWGFVWRRNLLGKAFLIYWPPKRFRILR
ncbi:MAG: signal peptidase I [Candidatus Omnitrophica bacterium 4484_213]|nr:MAG: signal peptidase I [Candidatus Omnitrophica bacterium 4484_213]